MRVLISGGGIAGLTLAFWLDRHGHQPVIVEKSPRLRDDGYMIDFFGAGYDVADKMGLLPELAAIHYQIARLAFLNAAGRETFAVPYATFRKLLGGRHFNFMRGELERVLYAHIEGRIPVRFATRVESFEQDGRQVHARFTDGTSESFDVLVGAEGVHSPTRQRAFGADSQFERFLGYYTAAFILDEVALGYPADAFYTLTVPERQVAVYPIRGDRFATFFIHKAHHVLDHFSAEAIQRELHMAYGDLGWVVPELLERAGHAPNLYFDAVTQIEMPTWSAGRVTLVGDACQCVSLVAGQGASMAMLGAYVLARELAAAGEDVAAALARYEHQMKPRIVRKQQAGRSFARWFVPDTPARLLIRDLSLRVTGWPVLAPLLRRQFAFGDALKL